MKKRKAIKVLCYTVILLFTFSLTAFANEKQSARELSGYRCTNSGSCYGAYLYDYGVSSEWCGSCGGLKWAYICRGCI